MGACACALALRRRRRTNTITPMIARPPNTPPTMPPIAPPDKPLLFEGGVVDVDVADAEADDREDDDAGTGKEVVGAAAAWRAVRAMLKEVDKGFSELSEENVSFIFVSDRFLTGFAFMFQLQRLGAELWQSGKGFLNYHVLIWLLASVHDSLLAC